MTDTEKMIAKTKEYILKLYSEGYSTHQNMVSGLKNGIDFLVGRKDNVETIKEDIISSCLREFEIKTKVFDKVGHLKMVEVIKSEFIQFVNGLNVDELTEISPIPFERRLNDEESQILTALLRDKFDFGSWKDENYYWEPVAKTENRIPIIYFEDDVFGSKKVERIIEIIESISGERIYLLTEEQLNYEVDTYTLNFDWNESAYCDFNASWLIYVSHEGTITFSGQKLIAEVENKLNEIVRHKNPWE